MASSDDLDVAHMNRLKRFVALKQLAQKVKDELDDVSKVLKKSYLEANMDMDATSYSDMIELRDGEVLPGVVGGRYVVSATMRKGARTLDKEKVRKALGDLEPYMKTGAPSLALGFKEFEEPGIEF